MSSLVRPELPTASVGSSQAPTAAVDNSAPFATRPQSTYKSGKAVRTSGATSADVFGAKAGDETKVDLVPLHAKIGQLALENDFLERALTKAGLLSAKP